MARWWRAHPADVIWLVLIAIGLGADPPLIRKGHQSVSQRAGCTAVRKGAVVYLACHFLGIWPRQFDPLSRVADRLRRDHPATAAVLSPIGDA